MESQQEQHILEEINRFLSKRQKIEEEGEEDAEEEGEKDDASDETPREVVSRVLRIRHMDQGTLPRCYALHEDLEPAEQCFMRVDPNSVAGWPGYLYRPP